MANRNLSTNAVYQPFEKYYEKPFVVISPPPLKGTKKVTPPTPPPAKKAARKVTKKRLEKKPKEVKKTPAEEQEMRSRLRSFVTAQVARLEQEGEKSTEVSKNVNAKCSKEAVEQTLRNTMNPPPETNLEYGLLESLPVRQARCLSYVSSKVEQIELLLGSIGSIHRSQTNLFHTLTNSMRIGEVLRTVVENTTMQAKKAVETGLETGMETEHLIDHI